MLVRKTLIELTGSSFQPLSYRDNISNHGEIYQDGWGFGIKGDSANSGCPSIDFMLFGCDQIEAGVSYLPNSIFDKNVMAGILFDNRYSGNAPYPFQSTNYYFATETPNNPTGFANINNHFVNRAAGNYRIANGTPGKNGASDGTDVGANIDAIELVSANAVTGIWAAITGTITYGNALGNPAPPRFISNVLISGSGSPNVSTTTNSPGAAAGQYTLTGFGSGAYTVTPSKTGGVNAAITSFDAARVAQHAAGSVPLTGNQLPIADVSENNVITSFDAGLIARYVAGQPDFGATATWRFFTDANVPFPLPTPPPASSRTYSSVTANINGEDYTGLLMGEVSGNWNNTGARPAGDGNLGGRGPVRDATVTLPNSIVIAGKDIVIPVNVQGVAGNGVIGYEFDLRYDPRVILPVAEPVDVVGTISRKFEIVTNAHEPGLLRVVVYGPRPIEENGVLLKLRFVAIGPVGSVSLLAFERMMFNEGELGVGTVGGRVEISAMPLDVR
ncbi:MAG: cohesin domain-containing protein [Pyrinomonadaceae bacterium]